MRKGKIIVQVGNTQDSFSDGEYCSSKSCDLLEDVISCNKQKLSEHGGGGRVRFIDEGGNLRVQLTLTEGNSYMTDEGKAIIVIRSEFYCNVMNVIIFGTV